MFNVVVMLQFELLFILNWLASLLLVKDALKLFRGTEVIHTAIIDTGLVMVLFTCTTFSLEVAIGHSFPDSVGRFRTFPLHESTLDSSL